MCVLMHARSLSHIHTIHTSLCTYTHVYKLAFREGSEGKGSEKIQGRTGEVECLATDSVLLG